MVYRIGAETLPILGTEAADAAFRVGSGTRAWRFDDFEFDLRRGELHGRDGVAIALRPKAEVLLRQFLAQPGRLFSRDELIAAVWPAAVVTDDSLVQCVGELRAALDDHSQRLIRTVPRRGYRFEAAVVPVVDLPLAVNKSPDQAAPIIDSPSAAAESAGPEMPAPASLQPTASSVAARPARHRRSWRSIALFVLGLGVVFGGGAAFYLRPDASTIDIDEALGSRYTVAVMPFAINASEPRLRNFADAVADAITAEFSTRKGVRGIGRAATQPFDGPAPPLARLASALKATYVVTGRVTPAGGAERMSIDVQIIEVVSGKVIWARQFERSVASGAPGISEVGQHVVNALRMHGPKAVAVRAAQPGYRPDAVDLTELGWNDLDQFKSPADIQRARSRFETAVRADPRSIIALNGLAAALSMGLTDPKNQTEQFAEYERVSEAAHKLAPDDATALMLWGNMQNMGGRADLALPAYEKATRLTPSFPNGHVLTAHALLLLGRTGEVQAAADRAVERGAGDARRVSNAHLFAAEAAVMRGDDARAQDLAGRAIAERPSNAKAHATLAAAEALAGRTERAGAAIAAYRKLVPDATVARYDRLFPSTHPDFVAQRARLYEGLRKAGLPDR